MHYWGWGRVLGGVSVVGNCDPRANSGSLCVVCARLGFTTWLNLRFISRAMRVALVGYLLGFLIWFRCDLLFGLYRGESSRRFLVLP